MLCQKLVVILDLPSAHVDFIDCNWLRLLLNLHRFSARSDPCLYFYRTGIAALPLKNVIFLDYTAGVFIHLFRVVLICYKRPLTMNKRTGCIIDCLDLGIFLGEAAATSRGLNRYRFNSQIVVGVVSENGK